MAQDDNPPREIEKGSATEISWEDSPDNPLNWPKFKRIFHSIIPGMTTLVLNSPQLTLYSWYRTRMVIFSTTL